ncbi:MAG: peptide-methionine (R)-S-oxide reductase, partial [Acetobacteraceae bacterium]|nr:peptide-methionine (R)-S-oxide reductase [Acetobacteraceae bacterium]
MVGLFSKQTQEDSFPVTHTEEEWRQRLTPEQFRILRKHGTERAGTSPLNAEKGRG